MGSDRVVKGVWKVFGVGALSRAGLGEVVAAASLCCSGVSCCSLLSVVVPRFQFRQLAQG